MARGVAQFRGAVDGTGLARNRPPRPGRVAGCNAPCLPMATRDTVAPPHRRPAGRGGGGRAADCPVSNRRPMPVRPARPEQARHDGLPRNPRNAHVVPARHAAVARAGRPMRCRTGHARTRPRPGCRRAAGRPAPAGGADAAVPRPPPCRGADPACAVRPAERLRGKRERRRQPRQWQWQWQWQWYQHERRVAEWGENGTKTEGRRRFPQRVGGGREWLPPRWTAPMKLCCWGLRPSTATCKTFWQACLRSFTTKRTCTW